MKRLLVATSLLLFLSADFTGLRCEDMGPKDRLPVTFRKTRYFFKDKEVLRFYTYSQGLKSGQGELVYHGTVGTDGRTLQHVTLSVSALSMKDDEDIYGVEDFSAPVRVVRRVALMGRREAITEIYAADKKSVTIQKSVDGRAAPTQVLTSERELGNLLLLLYQIRSVPAMSVGQVFKFALPTQTFDLVVKEKKQIRVPLGTFDSFVLVSQPSKYMIWISDDSQRIPLKIRGLVPLGLAYLAIAEVD